MGILSLVRKVGVGHAKLKSSISRRRVKVESAVKKRIRSVKSELTDINKEIDKARFKGLSKTEKNRILARRRAVKRKIKSQKNKAKDEFTKFVKRRVAIAKKNVKAEAKRLSAMEKKKKRKTMRKR